MCKYKNGHECLMLTFRKLGLVQTDTSWFYTNLVQLTFLNTCLIKKSNRKWYLEGFSIISKCNWRQDKCCHSTGPIHHPPLLCLRPVMSAVLWSWRRNVTLLHELNVAERSGEKKRRKLKCLKDWAELKPTDTHTLIVMLLASLRLMYSLSGGKYQQTIMWPSSWVNLWISLGLNIWNNVRSSPF